jgi:hypothetical protein
MTTSNEYDPDEEAVRDLLKGAGKRRQLPGEDLAAITEAARIVWRTQYARNEPRAIRRWWPIPAAAAILFAAGVVWWTGSRPVAVEAPVMAAEVERASGLVLAVLGEDEPSLIITSQPLAAGSVVETQPDARLALRLAGGESLRLDAASRARLVSARVVELERGALYLDTAGRGAVTVRTFAGDFHPAGTQFEVRIDESAGRSVRLRVREGQVRLDAKNGSTTAVAGEELIVRDGKMTRGRALAHEESWNWVVESVPMMDIEGRTLRDFLIWLAREKGWTLEYAGPDDEALSGTITLHGSVERQTADEALRIVTMSSGLEYRLRDGVLTIGRARP